MSVINTMLQDLKQRGGEHPVQGQASSTFVKETAAPVVSDLPKRGWLQRITGEQLLKWVGSLLLLAALFVAGERWFEKQDSEKVQVQVDAPAVVAATQRVEKGEEEQPPQPRELQESKSKVKPIETAAAQPVVAPVPTQKKLKPAAKPELPLLEQLAQAEKMAQFELAKKAINQSQSQPPVEKVVAEQAAVVLIHDLLPIELPLIKESKEDEKPANEPKPLKKEVLPPSATALAEQSYSQAVKALKVGDRAAAEKHLLQAVTHQPQHRGAIEAYSVLLLSSGQNQKASQQIDLGLSHFPHRPLLLQLKSRVLMRTGQLDQAVLLLEQNSAYLQQSTDSMALLAALYQQQKSHPKAIQLYRTLLQSDIQNGVWSMGLAVALDSMGKEKEARGYYEKAYRSGRLKTEALNFVRKKLGSDALQ
ncbi:MAG: hypothetical protein HOL04_11125 [Gammaproteobacteria bacterium]|jgi:tetratricopeptide (TPR) repeat protein|nr:hypothetical protein [Gammaproteobacteria bacterium]MBT4607731.1 hypothetical protein [Thiotrichales bacterium]MBT3472907.1 hypothetical protein [Gammaproteobacteria bacterium]MBT3966575.1 hypothetical protein [Gammaproteobacteria bacterium]MBT4081733.1 hypothetical protein [Gammaproteobacteria bacterium]